MMGKKAGRIPLQTQYVPEVLEVDVLIGVANWLYSKGWQIEKVSPHSPKDKEKIKTGFAAAGISIGNIAFQHSGEDIRAKQWSNIWKIECKGLSSGKRETDKNNFDRAVASCVSYFTKKEGLRLGLALPECKGYKKFLRDKLPQALREALELWVFLYCGEDGIYEFAPNEAIPA